MADNNFSFEIYFLRESPITLDFKSALYFIILFCTDLSFVPIIVAARIPAFFPPFKATVATGADAV